MKNENTLLIVLIVILALLLIRAFTNEGKLWGEEEYYMPPQQGMRPSMAMSGGMNMNVPSMARGMPGPPGGMPVNTYYQPARSPTGYRF